MKKPAILGGSPRLWDLALRSTESLFKETGNTGNLAFRYAVFKHLGRSVSVYSGALNSEEINNNCGVGVLPCANVLGSHHDAGSRASALAKLKIPLVAIGLGAQSGSYSKFPEVPAGTLQWLHEIYSRRKGAEANIAVRGEYTRKVLEHLGFREGIEVLGCPSLFIHESPNLGQIIAKRLNSKPVKIGVAAGNPSRPVSKKLELKLLEYAASTGGSYVIQHPLEFVKAARREARDLSPEWSEKILKFIGGDAAQNNSFDASERAVVIEKALAHAQVFFDIDSWMQHLQNHDLVIGMRIHGIMLALQAGIPAVCITHDSRTQELCETMMIPFIAASVLAEKAMTVQAILDYCSFDPNAFDRNRAMLAARYCQVLQGSGIRPAAFLTHLQAS